MTVSEGRPGTLDTRCHNDSSCTTNNSYCFQNLCKCRPRYFEKNSQCGQCSTVQIVMCLYAASRRSAICLWQSCLIKLEFDETSLSHLTEYYIDWRLASVQSSDLTLTRVLYSLEYWQQRLMYVCRYVLKQLKTEIRLAVFCRAMLCISAAYRCPSRSCIVSKRLKIRP